MRFEFSSIAELIQLCDTHQCTMGEVMIEREMELFDRTRDSVVVQMERALDIMERAIAKSLSAPQVTMGGLIGGEAIKVNQSIDSAYAPCGTVATKAVAYAMGTLEVNASMGLIVAAPTAGSSGVLPGVLFALKESYDFSHAQILDAMFTASAIGYIVSLNATVAGAEGGCQAEVGTASAMAAAAATQLMGGTTQQCCYASSSAITNLMGLVCDPIRGLVEAPCQGRNAIGVTNALLSAQLSVANAVPTLPLDEVISAMYRVGRSMPMELRETALGGVASCPSAGNCHACANG